MLTHETLHWAKSSKQPIVFLKLNFSKAYDKVSWHFLFHAMKKMRMSGTFISWVKLLFDNATIDVNGSLDEEFPIERGVTQGCHLVPYLFLTFGEALTHTIKENGSNGNIKGHHPSDKVQTIEQITIYK